MEKRNSPDETRDTLFEGRLSVIQSKAGYRFSIDALLLAHFAVVRKGNRVIDLGT
jgi:tRNA1Val (adenine37-N6)-methyltransferase